MRSLPSRAQPSRALPSRALPSRALPSRTLPSRAQSSRTPPSPILASRILPEVQVQLAGQRYVAVAAAEPPHRLVGLRGFVLGDRITDPRVKAPQQAVWPSNGGICVLGQLIADVTGMPYAEAAAGLVLEPLGLRDWRFPAVPADIGPGAVDRLHGDPGRRPRALPGPGVRPAGRRRAMVLPGRTWSDWPPGGLRSCPRPWPARRSPRRPNRARPGSGSASAGCSTAGPPRTARPPRTAAPGSRPSRCSAAASATAAATSC